MKKCRSKRPGRPFRSSLAARFVGEKLEDRLLLAVTPLSLAEQDAVVELASGLSSFAAQLESRGDAGRLLSGINEKIGERLDPVDIVDQLVASPILDLFQQLPLTVTADDIATTLDSIWAANPNGLRVTALDGVSPVEPIVLVDDAHSTTYPIAFRATRTFDTSIDLAEAFPDLLGLSETLVTQQSTLHFRSMSS